MQATRARLVECFGGGQRGAAKPSPMSSAPATLVIAFLLLTRR